MLYNSFMEKEVWKSVVGYEGFYEVSSLGRVKSLPRNGTVSTGRVLCPELDKNGYLRVLLQKNGDKKHCLVHRLVAQAFIPNPENKPQVNHKNGVRGENCTANLEWVTASENQQHKFDVLGYDKTYTMLRGKKIRCVETGEVFLSLHDAERKTGIGCSHICQVLKGMRNTAGNLHWEYIDEKGQKENQEKTT